jgi:hypothetical protein
MREPFTRDLFPVSAIDLVTTIKSHPVTRVTKRPLLYRLQFQLGETGLKGLKGSEGSRHVGLETPCRFVDVVAHRLPSTFANSEARLR